MASRADAKWVSHVDAPAESQIPLRATFNFVGLYPEIRLMIYKEAFKEIHILVPKLDLNNALDDLENILRDQHDSKTKGGFDDSGGSSESDQAFHSTIFDDLSDFNRPCEVCENLENPRDCDVFHGRVSLTGKLGLPLASKAIYAEALPVLYQMHHFKMIVWKKPEDCHDRRPLIEDINVLQHYFLRRNPRLVEHMTHVEILFDSNCCEAETLGVEKQYLTTSLLQDIAAACPKLKTFRFSTFAIPQEWNPRSDDRPNLLYDLAIERFRTFLQHGCNLEFQIIAKPWSLESFVNGIAPLSTKDWKFKIPFDWHSPKGEYSSDWDEQDYYNMCRLSALSYSGSKRK